MKTKTRVRAANQQENILYIMSRLCWPDCHKGVTYSWIKHNISQKFNTTTHINEYLVAIGFLEKKGYLYFHTGLTPSLKLANELVMQRRNKHKKSPAKIAKAPKATRLELFESLSSVFQTTKEEQEFIIALRNLLNSNQTQTPTQNS